MAAPHSRERTFGVRPPPILGTSSWRRELSPATSSTTSTEQSPSLSSSSSSQRNRHCVNGTIHSQCSSPRRLYVNTVIQPQSHSRHYENVCQDSLPPSAFQARKTSRESSVTDSENSTSSAASAGAFSESSEIRGLMMTPTLDVELKKQDAFEHYNLLKIKPGSKVSERTRQILYRPNHMESDSSSSLAESTDSLNTKETKQREIEHYNKLKLDLDKLSGNKSALIGLKILYRDPPRGYRQSAAPPTSTRSLAQQRRSRGIFHRKDEEPWPRTRYWSESHSNKLHSVSPNPVRSKSLNWQPQESGSQKTSANPQVGFPSSHPPAFRSRSLSDTMSSRVAKKDVELKAKKPSSRSIDNITQLSTFQSSGTIRPPVKEEVDPYSTLLFQPRARVYTDPGISSRGQASHNHLTNDVGRKLGNTKSLPVEDRSSGSICFIESPTNIVYDGDELEYHSSEHNFTIKIPKGATKKRGTTEIQIGLALHGPFTFPDRTQNVSPILWLCAIPDTKLRKPVQITLPHCITNAHHGSLKHRRGDEGLALQFASASLKSGTSSKSRKRQFEFHPTEGEEVLWPSETCGSILMKNLSPVCIVASSAKTADLKRELSLHACYCIVPVVPQRIQGRDWSIHFCITFHLQSCIQSLKSYFNSHEFQFLPPQPFQFSPLCDTAEECDGAEREGVSGDGEAEPELEIRFPRELPESGWQLFLKSEEKVAASSITFSPCRRADALHLLTSSLSSSSSAPTSTPPGFTIVVDGERAERAAVTCVSFVGSTEPVTVKVSLPLYSSSCRDSSTDNSTPLPPSPPASPDTDYDHLENVRPSPPPDHY